MKESRTDLYKLWRRGRQVKNYYKGVKESVDDVRWAPTFPVKLSHRGSPPPPHTAHTQNIKYLEVKMAFMQLFFFFFFSQLLLNCLRALKGFAPHKQTPNCTYNTAGGRRNLHTYEYNDVFGLFRATRGAPKRTRMMPNFSQRHRERGKHWG